jgi:undecaprenyl-diphosphatase
MWPAFSRNHTPLGLIAVLAALAVVVLGVLFAGDTGPSGVDEWIRHPTEDAARRPWRTIALAVNFWGEPAGAAVLVGVTVAVCLRLRCPRAAVLTVAGPGLTVGTTTLLKYVVGRTIHGPENLSYPSGHTGFITAFAVVVALLAAGRFGLGRTAGTLLVLTAALVAGAAMGWAQIALNAHYPTDVLGGWCSALAVTPATAWLVNRTNDAASD